jgi:hypothetical protein
VSSRLACRRKDGAAGEPEARRQRGRRRSPSAAARPAPLPAGAKEVQCIKTKGSFASIGDIITCSVKKAIRGKVEKVRGAPGRCC